MPEPRSADPPIDALKPRELVELLDRMNSADVTAMDIDVDAIGRSLDPGKLRGNQLAALLAAIDRLAGARPDVDLGAMSPRTFARLVSLATKEQLRAVVAEPGLRAKALAEIFGRMPAHLRADKARDVRAVVHWRFTEGTGEGGYDRYETVIAEGRCEVNREMTAQPGVTLTLSPVDFLKLCARAASAPGLFLTGKVKVRGDLALAATLVGFFDLPRP